MGKSYKKNDGYGYKYEHVRSQKKHKSKHQKNRPQYPDDQIKYDNYTEYNNTNSNS